MSEDYYQHTFPNGLTLLAQRVPAVQSAAMTLLLPAGSSTDPGGNIGSAAILSDLVLRGAGSRDSRQLTDYLDALGLQRSSSVGVHHTRFGCAAVASKVIESLPTYADIVRRPHLPELGFQAARDLALQALAGIEDEPRQKLIIKLRECFFPGPLGRNPMGIEKDLKKLTLAKCRHDWEKRYHGNQGIIAIAGQIDFKQVHDDVEKCFADLPSAKPPSVPIQSPGASIEHEKQKSEQTHIGIAYPSVPETDPDYYVIRVAMEILGGGMSSRLFTEVREKRGLCYSVWAGYTSLKDLGAILLYAGTSNERAQATLDCLFSELHRLSKGITQSELDRARIGLKAATIIQGESTSARCGAIAQDYFMRGRIRTLDEIKAKLDEITLDRMNAYLKSREPGPFTVVTVGPKPLKLPG